MRPVRYIFINRGLGMSPGKIGAQAAHAEMLAMHDLHNTVPVWNVYAERLYEEWIDSGHYTKLTMLAEDSVQLYSIERYLKARGYRTYLVIDEGRTEIDPFSPTALAVELVDKDDERVQQHFGEFRVYKEKKEPRGMAMEKKRWWQFNGK